MKTTDKQSCRTIIGLLAAHGIEDVVLSPGSRNAPLIIAAKRHPGLRTHIVIDERSAAFFGLGIALHTGKPVALVCTSGSAVLNYAPAISEAFYRHIPLIAISADRPPEWIDQDDSQTIHQAGVLGNIVKGSFDIGVETGSAVQASMTARTVNDAIILACRHPRGPVHINVRLDEPLGDIEDVAEITPRTITTADLQTPVLTDCLARDFAESIAGKRTLVIAGFAAPDDRLSTVLEDFVKKTGAVVMYEAQSNLHTLTAVQHIDATLATFDAEDYERLRPELVITFGGSIVSRMIKSYLRGCENLEHWHIGSNAHSVDCFMALTRRIECSAFDFFKAMTKYTHDSSSNAYLTAWLEKSLSAKFRTANFLNACPWSDFYAIGRLMQFVPRDWQLHFSNGTAIRYAQLFDYSAFNRIECNRGVSGIDGCTSTAIGAHIKYTDVTLLVSGDMSAQYDSGALALTEITPRFKLAVLNNSGGGIFRFIKSTSSLDECEECFAADVRLPLRQLADAYGFAYFEASNKTTFDKAFSLFAAENSRPAILNIITPAQESADIIKKYFTI